MADLVVTPASVLTSDIAKAKRGIAGATIVHGKALYLDSADNKLKLADSNSGSAGAALRTFKGIALNAAPDGQPGLRSRR